LSSFKLPIRLRRIYIRERSSILSASISGSKPE
jgi:hypothetical protein